jgi:hypothetical protein
MKTIAIASISGLSNHAMLASWVEKPPVPSVAKAWQTASNKVMPP